MCAGEMLSSALEVHEATSSHMGEEQILGILGITSTHDKLNQCHRRDMPSFLEQRVFQTPEQHDSSKPQDIHTVGSFTLL